MSATPPILFLVFNRPEQTAQVFESIRQARPAQLFIAADGPRHNKPGESELCRQVRTLTTNVDWPCEVKTLFREENLGCGKNVSAAISWFFAEVEEGIILEDDCLPHHDFYTYCAELLEKYRYDNRVALISGHNPLTEWHNGYSYLFSKIGAIWGWASWRRAWQYYDYELKYYEQAIQENWLGNVFCSEQEKLHREKVVGEVYMEKNDTWDYQWTFARLINNALSTIPSKNLVQNIGFGEAATHTIVHDTRFVNQPVYAMHKPMQHPPFVFADAAYDKARFSATLPASTAPAAKTTWKTKIKQRIKIIIYGR